MVVLGIVADKTSSNPGDLGLFGPLLGIRTAIAVASQSCSL